MIDPSFDRNDAAVRLAGAVAESVGTTLTPDQIHPFPPTMQELERKVAMLTNELTAMENDRNFWQGKAHERMLMIDNLEEWLREQYNYIDEEFVQSLVDIFGLTITKEYDVQVTVTFSGTLSAPLDYDLDELENALEARLDTSYYAPGDLVIDLSEDSMDIDWTES